MSSVTGTERTGVGGVWELAGRLGEVVRELDALVCDGGLAKEYVEAFARLERLAGAGKTLALAQVERTGAWAHGPGARRSVGDWLATLTGAPTGDAIREAETARRLGGLPDTTDALRAGALSAAQASEITGAALDAPGAEHDLLELAGSGRPFKALRDHARRARAAAHDDNTRAERQHGLRQARRWTDEEGMRRYAVALTPEQASVFEPAWDTYCNQIFETASTTGRREPHDKYATDALVLMARTALTPTTDTDSTAGGAPDAHVLVLVDATALRRGHTIEGETCEIAGIGPIDITAARELLGDATIDILIRDGIDIRAVAHTRRSPNRRQRAALLADWECEIRGCGATRHLEIDHITPYAHNGRTAIEDLGTKCRYHHYLKTHQGWTDTPRGPDGKRDLNPPDTRDPQALG